MRFWFTTKQRVQVQVKNMGFLSLKKEADNLEKIKKETAKTHQVTGSHNGFRWQLVLANRNPKSNKLEEIPGAAARFNESKPDNIVAFWKSGIELADYLRKCSENRAFIADNKQRLKGELADSIRVCVTESSKQNMNDSYAQKTRDLYLYPPHSNILLAESALTAFGFVLEDIEGIIDQNVKAFIADFGSFPIRPQIVSAYPDGNVKIFNGFQVAIRIWKD